MKVFRPLRPRRLVLPLAAAAIFLTAGASLAASSFAWTFARQGAVKDLLVLEDFTTTLTNTGAAADSFRVTLVKDMPPFWQATICQGPVCYPPSITVHTFILGPGEATNLDFALTAAVDEGTGTSTATVSSLSDPTVTATNSFSIVTSGLQILHVDADGGAGYAPYFSAAIASSGRSLGTWNRGFMGALSATDLACFEAVVWSVGTGGQGLTEADRAALAEYVQNGGSLFLTGQDLARDSCDPAHPAATPATRAWFQDILGVDYLADDAATSLVNGVPGDPVSDGMLLAINGGDGAGANTSCDEIVAMPHGTAALTYFTGQAAAVRGSGAGGRTFFASFGFESVATVLQREQLMTSVLDWITSKVTGVDGPVPGPPAAAPCAVPNPFNPMTSIMFVVGGERAAEVAVTIHDLRGRAVRTLFRGRLDPGRQALAWNGRDDRGRSLGSGLYLARVRVADRTATVKMTLAR